jgi:hypothetical protein
VAAANFAAVATGKSCGKAEGIVASLAPPKPPAGAHMLAECLVTARDGCSKHAVERRRGTSPVRTAAVSLAGDMGVER